MDYQQLKQKIKDIQSEIKEYRVKIKELQKVERILLDQKHEIEYKTPSTLTYEYLITRIEYNPETGIFVWINHKNKSFIGHEIIGSVKRGGYRALTINGKQYAAHRLAWLYMNKEFPQYQIDHIDNDPSNNKWDNLREATRSQNGMNKKKYKNNSSGYKGVTWHKTNRKWMAQATLNGDTVGLGGYDTPEKAYEAYCEFVETHHGEFVNLG